MVGLGCGLTQPVFIFRVDQFTNARGQDLNPLRPARIQSHSSNVGEQAQGRHLPFPAPYGEDLIFLLGVSAEP